MEEAVLEQYANCVKKCLENSLHDERLAKDEKVLVMYANVPVAYSKLQEHFKNGSNVGPLITFYQSGIEVDTNQAMCGFKKLTVVRDTGNYSMQAPVICKINYTVTINALTELQADLLQAQLMQATPFMRPYYTKLNGQFVLIQSTDVRNLGTVDVGENKDKIAQREVSLTIDRAYLNYDYQELNAGTIYINKKELDENKEVAEKLKNGEYKYKDGTTSGLVEKNYSGGRVPFIYNVANEEGEIVQKTELGKLKVRLYSLEGAEEK